VIVCEDGATVNEKFGAEPTVSVTVVLRVGPFRAEPLMVRVKEPVGVDRDVVIVTVSGLEIHPSGLK
jgi:hypothetical protein